MESDHFSEVADEYRAHRPGYPGALGDFLREIAPENGLAWDAGCGSGQLAVLLAERFDRVIATDFSARQLAQAPPHRGVEFRLAPAEASGLPGGIADLCVAAQAAHWFDLERYYEEVRRVSRPGAAVALVGYGSARIDEAIDPVVDRFYSGSLASHWPPERRHVEEGYRSLPFPFTEVDAPELEIRLGWSLSELLGYIRTWSAVRSLQRVDASAFETFERELATAWGEKSVRRTIRWPLGLRAGHL